VGWFYIIRKWSDPEKDKLPLAEMKQFELSDLKKIYF
jgi:hypothetical protein